MRALCRCTWKVRNGSTNNELAVERVNVGAMTYYNALATGANLTSIGAMSGADSFDGADLHISCVLGGQRPIRDVVLKVALANLAAVKGGMPGA